MHHSLTQRDKGGTCQNQKTVKRYGDLKRSMQEESQVLETGGSYADTGNGNGGKIGDTKYYSWGKQVIISRGTLGS